MPILVFQPENRIRTKKSTHMRIIFKLQKPKMKGTLERQQRKKFYRGTKTRITLLSQKPCLKERKFWKKNNKTKIQVSVRRAIICQHEAYFKFHPNYVYMYLYVGVCVCVQVPIEARAAISPGTGVTNDGEPPDILGTELRPSARTICIFTYSTILQL